MGVSKVVYGDNTLVDLTNDSVSETTLAKGVTAHNAAGDQVTGTMEAGTSVTKETITEALGYTPTKAWYVTFTTASDNSITADKTVAEIYQAYQDGYAVYGFCDSAVLVYPIAIDSDVAIFSHIYNENTILATTATVEWNSQTSKWDVTTNVLCTADVIESGIPNPEALTINSGGTTITYDGSEAKTIDISSSGTGQSPLIVNVTLGDQIPNTTQFTVTSVDKTITEIYNAYANGQVVFAKDTLGLSLQLFGCSSTEAYFSATIKDTEIAMYYLNYDNSEWTYGVELESMLVNKVLAALPTWTGGSY